VTTPSREYSASHFPSSRDPLDNVNLICRRRVAEHLNLLSVLVAPEVGNEVQWSDRFSPVHDALGDV
jgi:hypothetical protein